MPLTSGSTGGGSDLIVYPIDHMRETATKLLAQAGEKPSGNASYPTRPGCKRRMIGN